MEIPAGAGMLSASSGTTTAVEELETATLLMSSAGGAETAIPPPISAMEGSTAQALRQGTVNVFG